VVARPAPAVGPEQQEVPSPSVGQLQMDARLGTGEALLDETGDPIDQAGRDRHDGQRRVDVGGQLQARLIDDDAPIADDAFVSGLVIVVVGLPISFRRDRRPGRPSGPEVLLGDSHCRSSRHRKRVTASSAAPSENVSGVAHLNRPHGSDRAPAGRAVPSVVVRDLPSCAPPRGGPPRSWLHNHGYATKISGARRTVSGPDHPRAESRPSRTLWDTCVCAAALGWRRVQRARTVG
jgi:hypothetical protein